MTEPTPPAEDAAAPADDDSHEENPREQVAAPLTLPDPATGVSFAKIRFRVG